MTVSILDFVAAGSPPTVSRAIEEFAASTRRVTAIVVPWESDGVTLSMAVTSVKADGWAIEHTNLGTIRLTDLGGDRTEVAIAADQPSHPERQQLASLFQQFAQQIKARFQVAS